jgi:hypothetical protein
MEDEGRHFYIMGPVTREVAENWIKAQKDEYFKPGDYYITEVGDGPSLHGRKSQSGPERA